MDQTIPPRPATRLPPAIVIKGLTKTYRGGFQALAGIDLEIESGEIFALLGPNGAGKTTLISIVCGIASATAGTVLADGHDTVADYRAARTAIGLVPQELSTDAFETVSATVGFSRGLFGKPANRGHIEKVLRDLSLWDKRDSKIITLSGGMKRRVMIAKALSHEPRILFLDEPTAGVDVELRRDMWEMVRALRATGVTIVLTTHYIEEAEEMADRVGVIDKRPADPGRGEGCADAPPRQGPPDAGAAAAARRAPRSPCRLAARAVRGRHGAGLQLRLGGREQRDHRLLRELDGLGLDVRNLQTRQSSLEDIFVDLVHARS